MESIDDACRYPTALVAPWVLLFLAESSSHGYELIERLKAAGFPDTFGDRVYRQLRHLENARLVRSYLASSQIRGPARRIYELTSAGRDALGSCAQATLDLTLMLESYRRRFETLPPAPMKG